MLCLNNDANCYGGEMVYLAGVIDRECGAIGCGSFGSFDESGASWLPR